MAGWGSLFVGSERQKETARGDVGEENWAERGWWGRKLHMPFIADYCCFWVEKNP
jgi:hypothetical protein